ncbi:MAG: polysaccharide biosynthesis/export family protein [Candidatus Omnitrophota bacterium]
MKRDKLKQAKMFFIGLIILFFLSGMIAAGLVMVNNIYAQEISFVQNIDDGLDNSEKSMDYLEKKVDTRRHNIKKEEYTGEYTLGKDDIIDVNVRRHPEFSGRFTIGPNGKIQYPFVGDISLADLTKTEAVGKLTSIISKYVANAELDITIIGYNSKVVYVIGQVGRPGRYSMHSEYMPVRDALLEAGLPRENIAALRRAMIVRPVEGSKPIVKKVNLLNLIYNGELEINYDLRSGDIVYVPSTTLYKIGTVMEQIVSPFIRSSAAYNVYEEDVLYRDQPRRD